MCSLPVFTAGGFCEENQAIVQYNLLDYLLELQLFKDDHAQTK